MTFDEKSENKVAFFLDILGVRNSSDRNRLLKLLEFISQNNSDGHVKSGIINDGPASGIGYKVTPTFSSFSDSIIITSPTISNFNKQDNLISSFSAIFFEKISPLISECLKMGFLIRGAVDYGKIYHTREIVNGEPLDNAVYAEKNIAIYPRIILCKNVIAAFNDTSEPYFQVPNEMHKIKVIDQDGIYYLNWLMPFMSKKDKESQIDEIVNSINNIGIPSCNGKQKELAKWCWMINYLNRYAPLYSKNFNKIKIPSQVDWW